MHGVNRFFDISVIRDGIFFNHSGEVDKSDRWMRIDHDKFLTVQIGNENTNTIERFITMKKCICRSALNLLL